MFMVKVKVKILQKIIIIKQEHNVPNKMARTGTLCTLGGDMPLAVEEVVEFKSDKSTSYTEAYNKDFVEYNDKQILF